MIDYDRPNSTSSGSAETEFLIPQVGTDERELARANQQVDSLFALGQFTDAEDIIAAALEKIGEAQ